MIAGLFSGARTLWSGRLRALGVAMGIAVASINTAVVAQPAAKAPGAGNVAPARIGEGTGVDATPPWSVDVTGQLAFEQPEGGQRVTLSQFIARRDDGSLGIVPGDVITWSGRIAWPAQADAATPLVIEFDEGRLIESVSINGRAIGKPDVWYAHRVWNEGRGVLLLPRLPVGEPVEIAVTGRWLTHLYPNTFGRVIVRPAILQEQVKIGQPRQGEVTLSNLTDRPLKLAVHVEHEDYFGVPLGDRTQQVSLQPGGSGVVALQKPSHPDLYKTIVWAESGGQRTLPYWDHTTLNLWTHERPGAIALETGWEFSLIPTGPRFEDPLPPQDVNWQAVKIPHIVPRDQYKTRNAVYRRTIEIPPAWAGKRVEMMLPLVWYRATIYIDGNKVATRTNWQLPATIDLTDYLKPGQKSHELVISVRDWTAGLDPNVPVPPDGVNDAPDRALIASIPHLNNTYSAEHLGLNGVPELTAVEDVRIDWARIITEASTRTALKADVEIRSDRKAPVEAQLEAAVMHRGVKVMDLPVKRVTVAPGAVTSIHYDMTDAPGVKRWSPDEPNLHELRLTLKTSDGRTVDVRRERFGFREFGINGRWLTVNGEIFKVNGSGHILLNDQVWPVARLPYRMVRHHFHSRPGFIGGVRMNHLADEMGVLIKDENLSHNAHHQERYAYQLDVTFDNIYSEMEAVFRAKANHASTMMYGVGNELKYPGGDEPIRMGRLFARLRQLDPTRLVTISGSVPIPDGAELIDLHGRLSLDDRNDHWLFHPKERPSYLSDEGLYQYRPEGDRSTDWAPAQLVSGGAVAADGSKAKLLELGGRPVMFTECSYIEQDLWPGLSGWSAYQPIVTQRAGNEFAFGNGFFPLTAATVRRTAIQLGRQSGVPLFLIHVDRGITRSIAPVTLFPAKPGLRLGAGDKQVLDFTLHNDLTGQQSLTTRMTLWKDDRMLTEARGTHDVGPATISSVSFDLAGAGPLAPGDYDVVVEAWAADGRHYYRQWHPLRVFDSIRRMEGDRAVAVFDPAGLVMPWLTGHGVTAKPLSSPGEWNPADPLIIGGDALSTVSAGEMEAMREKVADGARLVVLDHRILPGFLSARLDQRLGSSGRGLWLTNAARVDVYSPLTLDLASDDLSFWKTRENDYASYRSPLRPPTNGRFAIHVMAGSRLADADEIPLLEIGEGDGTVLFCQMNISGALGLEPAADLLMRNIVLWAMDGGAGPTPGTAVEATPKPAILVGAGDSPVAAAMKRAGVRFAPAAAQAGGPLDPAALVVADGQALAALDEQTVERLVRHVSSGGTLFIHLGSGDPTPAGDQPGGSVLERLVGTDVAVEVFAHSRLVKVDDDPLFRGVLPSDLVWAELRNTELDKTTPPLPTDVIHARLTGSALRPLVMPAALATVERGAGRIVLSTLRLAEYTHPKPTRLLATLMGNLGASVALPSTSDDSNDDAKGFVYRPIDLRPSANWSLVDNPDAGRRGWIKAGAENDMRSLPSGTQELGGVTFDIIDDAASDGRSCVALSGTKEIGVLPAEIKGIRVDGPADRLVFLHASAWGEPGFTYRVWYTERKTWIPGQPDPFVDVVVKPGEHIADYFSATPILTGLQPLKGAKVAWAGTSPFSNKMERKVGVYAMTWDNPHPEKEIESIDILSPGTVGQGQVFVVAISAATRRPPLTLNDVLPENVQADKVAQWFSNDRYGVVVLKDGQVPVIHDGQGRAMMTTSPWALQTSRRLPNAKVEFGTADSQPSRVEVARREDEAGRTVITVTGTTRLMRWEMTLLCAPRTLSVSHRWEVTAAPPKDVELGMLVGYRVEAARLVESLEIKPGQMPLQYPMDIGVLSISIPERLVKWYQQPGYRVDGTGITVSPGATSQYVNGATVDLTVTIEVP